MEDGDAAGGSGGTAKAPLPDANADDNPLYKQDQFRMYCQKVLPCSKRYAHDWTSCPYAHPAEKARRRDPRVYTYTGVACPDMKKGVPCPRGDLCGYAHNVFEYWLHPSRYRTQLCNDGVQCKRKTCFFAHTLEELRVSSVKVVPSGLGGASQEALDPFTMAPTHDFGPSSHSGQPHRQQRGGRGGGAAAAGMDQQLLPGFSMADMQQLTLLHAKLQAASMGGLGGQPHMMGGGMEMGGVVPHSMDHQVMQLALQHQQQQQQQQGGGGGGPQQQQQQQQQQPAGLAYVPYMSQVLGTGHPARADLLPGASAMAGRTHSLPAAAAALPVHQPLPGHEHGTRHSGPHATLLQYPVAPALPLLQRASLPGSLPNSVRRSPAPELMLHGSSSLGRTSAATTAAAAAAAAAAVAGAQHARGADPLAAAVEQELLVHRLAALGVRGAGVGGDEGAVAGVQASPKSSPQLQAAGRPAIGKSWSLNAATAAALASPRALHSSGATSSSSGSQLMAGAAAAADLALYSRAFSASANPSPTNTSNFSISRPSEMNSGPSERGSALSEELEEVAMALLRGAASPRPFPRQ